MYEVLITNYGWGEGGRGYEKVKYDPKFRNCQGVGENTDSLYGGSIPADGFARATTRMPNALRCIVARLLGYNNIKDTLFFFIKVHSPHIIGWGMELVTSVCAYM